MLVIWQLSQHVACLFNLEPSPRMHFLLFPRNAGHSCLRKATCSCSIMLTASAPGTCCVNRDCWHQEKISSATCCDASPKHMSVNILHGDIQGDSSLEKQALASKSSLGLRRLLPDFLLQSSTDNVKLGGQSKQQRKNLNIQSEKKVERLKTLLLVEFKLY